MAENRYPINVDEAIHYLMKCEVQLNVAAEQASRDYGVKITSADMLAILSTNTTELLNQLKLKAIIGLFDNLMVTQLAYSATASSLGPAQVAVAYTAQMSAFNALVAKPLDDMAEAPVDIASARESLLQRAKKYQARNKPAEEENVS